MVLMMTMFKWTKRAKEKDRLRKMHNERCRRYYQRHLSKKAQERRRKEEEKRERNRLKAELMRKAGNALLTQKEVPEAPTIGDWLL